MPGPSPPPGGLVCLPWEALEPNRLVLPILI